jgi:ribonuclease D
MTDSATTTLIDSTSDLEEIARQARTAGAIGVDTEFVWERTFYPRLGLIQMALPDGRCFLFDVPAIGNLEPFAAVLADGSVVKIFHDAQQDLTILAGATGTTAKNIFDTRLAAGFCGLNSTSSLANLVNTILGVGLTKSHTRSDWLKRPLSPEQLSYACDDVNYLVPLRFILLGRITTPETRHWLAEELLGLADKQLANESDDTRYLKVKGARSLDRRGLAIVRELYRWRECEAIRRDRPRSHIMADKTMVTIARLRLNSIDKLRQSGALNERKLRTYGAGIASCVQKGYKVPSALLPEKETRHPLSETEKKAYNLLKTQVEQKCTMLGIDPALIATSSELKEIVSANKRASLGRARRLLTGWRGHFLADIIPLINPSLLK